MRSRAKYLIVSGIVLALVLFPLFTKDQFLLHNLVLIFLFVGITVAWSISTFGGAVSLGHSVFFGLGAYTSALLLIDFGINPWVGMVAAMAVAGAAAIPIAIPLLRLRGPFYTLATIAFVEVLRLLAVYARDITRGSEGLTIPSRPGWTYMSFFDREPYYYIVLVMAILTVGLSAALYHSWLGYQLRAAAADSDAVRALGVRVAPLQVLALVVSAALTGAFGAFAAQYFFIVDPNTVFSLTAYSIQPALNGIIGGMGTILGPIIGAILMTPLGEYLRGAFSGSQGLNFLIYGVALIVVVEVIPGGVVNALKDLRKRLPRRRPSLVPTSVTVEDERVSL